MSGQRETTSLISQRSSGLAKSCGWPPARRYHAGVRIARWAPWPTTQSRSRGKKGTVPICPNGPEGAAHIRRLSPFPPLLPERPSGCCAQKVQSPFPPCLLFPLADQRQQARGCGRENGRKRGQAPFAGTALRVLRTKGASPLFRLPFFPQAPPIQQGRPKVRRLGQRLAAGRGPGAVREPHHPRHVHQLAEERGVAGANPAVLAQGEAAGREQYQQRFAGRRQTVEETQKGVQAGVQQARLAGVGLHDAQQLVGIVVRRQHPVGHFGRLGRRGVARLAIRLPQP